MTQLLKGQVSKGFASCPVPQKEVGNVWDAACACTIWKETQPL